MEHLAERLHERAKAITEERQRLALELLIIDMELESLIEMTPKVNWEHDDIEIETQVIRP